MNIPKGKMKSLGGKERGKEERRGAVMRDLQRNLNTNLLDFSLWIAVRPARHLRRTAPYRSRYLYRSIARKIKKTSHITLATENMQRSGCHYLRARYENINKHCIGTQHTDAGEEN